MLISEFIEEMKTWRMFMPKVSIVLPTYNGEEYIVNDDGAYAHWDCIDYGRDLVKWLGYEIKEMEEINDEYNI